MKKKNFIFSAAVLFMASAMVASCASDDMTSETTNGKNVVTAKAILDGTTRVAYNENTSGGGITATWESDDYLNALETNSGTTTHCTFTNPTIDTDPVVFKSTDAEATSDATTWKAVLGKGAKVSGTTITCGYDGQVGTPANLENYDYRVATGTDKAPTFNFSGSETRLTYFLRLKVPAGIKQIEVCTGSWTITSTANTAPTASTDNVSTVTLENTTSAAGKIVYVAVPAIDYSKVGLIITIFNNVKANATMSQGKVISRDLSNLGGKIGDYDMSGFTLMARPTSSVDMGTAGKWAPFNVGATTATDYGNYYAWGKTEQSYDAGTTTLDYSWETYFPKVSGASESTCGTADDPIYAAGLITSTISGSTTTWSGSICNTKFDVARVKWGKGWKMPTYDQINILRNLTKSSVTNYNGVTVKGLSITSSNNTSTTLFLPYSGVSDGNTYYGNIEVSPYWQGTQYGDADDELEYCLRIPDSAILQMESIYRYTGSSVRPVSE